MFDVYLSVRSCWRKFLPAGIDLKIFFGNMFSSSGQEFSVKAAMNDNSYSILFIYLFFTF